MLLIFLTLLNLFLHHIFGTNKSIFLLPTCPCPSFLKLKKKNNANICTKSKEQIFSQEMAKGTVYFYAQIETLLWTPAVLL